MDQTERIPAKGKLEKNISANPLPKSKAETAKDPHLIDWGNVMEVAQWIGIFLLGLTADVAYDMTKDAVREKLTNIKRRFGKSKVRDIKSEMIEFIKTSREGSSLSDEEITDSIENIFKDFQ